MVVLSFLVTSGSISICLFFFFIRHPAIVKFLKLFSDMLFKTFKIFLDRGVFLPLPTNLSNLDIDLNFTSSGSDTNLSSNIEIIPRLFTLTKLLSDELIK